jgi:hypothetical protein
MRKALLQKFAASFRGAASFVMSYAFYEVFNEQMKPPGTAEEGGEGDSDSDSGSDKGGGNEYANILRAHERWASSAWSDAVEIDRLLDNLRDPYFLSRLIGE